VLDRLATFILGHRLLTGLVLALAVGTVSAGTTALVADFSIQAFFGSADPALTRLEAFRERWGPDDSILLVTIETEPGELLTPARMRVVSDLTDALEASAGVETLTGVYFEVRIWSAPAALANYVILGCFLGTQNPRAALLHLVCLNGVNIILDIAFVAGFGWGVAGVAAASVIAEYAALLLGAVLLARILRRIGGTWVRERILALAQLRRTLRAHGDIFIRTLCLLLAFGVFTAQGAKLGDVTLAANAILLNFQSFTAFALDGIAHAAEALVGGAFGARNRAALRSAVAISTLWAVVIAVAMTAVYAAGGTAIIGLLTSLADVRAVAAEHLIWAIALPLVSVWSYQLDGIYIGATRTAAMRNGMALSLAAYGVAMWLVFPAWGNHGLWFAFVVFMVARAITLAFWYPALERSLPATPSPAR